MDFENKIPEWKNEGTEPTEKLETGFTATYKPPAAFFNWFWNRVTKCINELQSVVKNISDKISKPNFTTAYQARVVSENDNSVTFAVDIENFEYYDGFELMIMPSRSVDGKVVGISINDTTEFTVVQPFYGEELGGDNWNYEIPKGVFEEYVPVILTLYESYAITKDNQCIKQENIAGGNKVYTAESTDGVTYTINDDTLPEPYNGMIITFTTNKTSTHKNAKLLVNGVGGMMQFGSGVSTRLYSTPQEASWLWSGTNVTLKYATTSMYANPIWIVQDRYMPPNATTTTSGLMSSTDKTKLDGMGYTYGTEDLTAGTSELETGKIYFVYE